MSHFKGSLQPDIFYFLVEMECDFIAKKISSFPPLKMTFQLADDNNEAEAEGVVQACKSPQVGNGVLFARNEEC